MKYTAIILIYTLFFINFLYCQEKSLPDVENIDSLFEESDEETQENTETETHEPEEEDTGDLLTTVLKKSDFTLHTHFKFYIGYALGWDRLFWDTEGETEIQYLDTALMKMQSIFTLNFQISPELRVLQKFSLGFPDFEVKVTEFFCDYLLLDTLFLRIGRQNITWGISRNFPFTNLLARMPDKPKTDFTDPDSYAVKINIPMGIGGIEGLVFTRDEYFPDEDVPAMEDIGYGGNINIATELVDINLGTYYHKDLNYRSYCSASFTLFDRLEMYTEGLAAFDLDYDENDTAALSDNPIDGSVNAGFYIDFFSGDLEINGEYFFNGEESELEMKGSQYPLFHGHNIAGNISLKVFDKKLRIFSQYKYSIDDDSHLLIPGMTIDILPQCSILFTIPVVFGSPEGGYYTENPDDKKRPISFVFAFLLSGKT